MYKTVWFAITVIFGITALIVDFSAVAQLIVFPMHDTWFGINIHVMILWVLLIVAALLTMATWMSGKFHEASQWV